LPHWEVEDGTYFITMRVHGTLPVAAESELKGIAEEIRRAEGDMKQRSHRRMFAAMEAWLDASKDRLYLSGRPVAEMIMRTICNLRERHIWEPVEYAIMPNHIHLLVALTESSLRPTMISFKRWTAGKAIAMLGLKTRPFWQEEWFDHWVRTDLEYTRIIEYIRANPVKAGLVRDYRDWPHGSWNEQTILNQEEAPK
jgi:REP element-mobilizing transposase RayT